MPMFGFICGDDLCAFYQCTQGCGCSQTPGIPCALSSFRGRVFCKDAGVSAPRECGPTPATSAHPSRRGASPAPQDEVVASGTSVNSHGEEARSAVSNHEARV